MKIYVFYRSNELSNQIATSTKQFFAKDNALKSLDIEFFNLDKRNYMKILKEAESELPDHIFIWYDEEKISDYMKKTYPSINVVHYTKELSVNYKENRWGFKHEYLLKDVIIDLLKKDMKKRLVYVVKGTEKDKLELDDIDIIKYKKNGYLCFDTEQDANEYLVNYLTRLIDSNKNTIESLKNRQKEIVKANKGYETMLSQLKK